MLKRILASMLCLILLLSGMPMGVTAATDEEHERIAQQISTVYYKTLSATGVSSLHGYCGMMAGYELYFLGVTGRPVTHNGNQMYDILSNSADICEGYVCERYPVSTYNLEEALNAVSNCGTRDVYNLMVGFQWTSTAAGSMYGHVTVIHAILDGIVYFTEGFITPFNADPSKAMICTIEEFADYYDSWTSFEGLIHFGSGNLVEGCDNFSCQLYVVSSVPKNLMSEASATSAVSGRTVAAGERLYANALCRNEDGELFYRVVEEGKESYISANNTKPVWFDCTDVSVSDIVLPQQVKPGKDFQLSGVIKSRYNMISSLVVQIRDASGEILLSTQMEKNGYMVDLSSNSVNTRVDISSLAEGSYTYEICCNLVNHYAMGDEAIGNVSCVTVASAEFVVGDVVPASMAKQINIPVEETKPDGWQLEDGLWYYYQDGKAREGWFCDEGVDYYFLENGAAATGWQTINGKARYFSETGAMRIGWMETAEGVYYMLSNGAVVTGLKKIDGVWHYFDENGMMLKDSTVEYKGMAYIIDAEGIATAK